MADLTKHLTVEEAPKEEEGSLSSGACGEDSATESLVDDSKARGMVIVGMKNNHRVQNMEIVLGSLDKVRPAHFNQITNN